MQLENIYQIVFSEYPDVLNVKQVSHVLGVSARTVYKIIGDGSLPHLKVGREFRVPKYFLLQYLNLINSNEKI